MNRTSGFREVLLLPSQSSTNRLLREQGNRFGTGFRQFIQTHNLIALSTGTSTKRIKVSDTFIFPDPVPLAMPIGSCTSDGVNSEQIPCTFSILTMSLVSSEGLHKAGKVPDTVFNFSVKQEKVPVIFSQPAPEFLHFNHKDEL
jgi:hypothetical protein